MSSTPSDSLIGTTVGSYRPIAVLGTGAMGTVYEAERVGGGDPVALKVMRPQDVRGDEINARLVREGKAMAMFNHPNIVELIEVGTLDDGSAFIATELVRGVSLRAIAQEGVADQKRVLAIMRQVLEALAHAHALGVVHRDIKPENIMVADGDRVKMLDFGVAKLLGDTAAVLDEGQLTQTGMAFGTPMYIAPESVLGRPIDQRIDLYAVGVILFELLAGWVPFDDPDLATLLRLHTAGPIPALKDRSPDRVYTPELELLVAEALVKNPELRFKTATEMIAALDAAVLSLPSPTNLANRSTMHGHALPRPPEPAPVATAPVVAKPDPRASGPGFSWSPPAQDAPRSPLLALPPAKRRQLYIGIGVGAAVLISVLAFALSGDKSTKAPAAAKTVAPGASREGGAAIEKAADHLAAGKPARAAGVIEKELATGASTDDAATHLTLGHARYAAGRRIEALSAYERAASLSEDVAGDAQLRTNATKIAEGRDAAAAMVALELLASRVHPPAHDVIIAQASTGKVADIRHRAFAIAERDGFSDKIDRFASWGLDLTQLSSCEERKIVITRLAGTKDPRAVPLLEKVKGQKCIGPAVTEALTQLAPR